MRKLLLIAAFMVSAMQAFAAQVDWTQAQATAKQFLQSNAARHLNAASRGDVRLLHTQMGSTSVTQPVYYIFNTDDAFVIVAGDDRAETILAYGNGALDMSTLPENMKFWLNHYQKQIEYLQEHPALKVEKTVLGPQRGESVEPMLEAMWNQGYPYYNQCPMDGDRRAQTGCAATSLAQVFYKWKYPTQPTPVVPGYTTRTRKIELAALPSITFDWDNMLPTYNFSATDTQRNAVAWLMRYIGQAEEMDYTNDGSEAWEDDVLRACHLFGYVDAYVKYKATLNFDTNGENILINDADWSVMLQEELAAGRPVVYCAYSYSNAYNSFYGHAFNVDGYDADNGTYSINWGWGGTGNGYYALRAFANQGYSYNLGELMVMGIEPPAPIEAYDPVMLPADSTHITSTSFRAQWTDETPAENVTSYTLEVSTGPASDPGVYEKVFSEYFPYCTSSGSSAITNLNNYCSNTGWTGSYAYEANGGLRLGSSSRNGSITTPALDMTQSGGKMTIFVTMKPYSSDKNVPVRISCGTSIVDLTVTDNATTTVILECEADDAQKVTIATTETGKRVVVTQVDIYSSTSDAAKQVLRIPVETGDSTMRVITDIMDKFYTVTGLTECGTFSYKVKALYSNGTQSAWSNIQEVTLFENTPAHDYQPGDVNHDHVVDITDATTLINDLLNSSSVGCPVCSDFTGDHLIDISDATALINYLLIK
ncbi:MAG: C10 family peptidase [Muribaculaceae bacterium]|nr:C10 family peptidase [Muribaculaceae bacterium]